MLAETAMGLAAPWPLKIVLDSVFDNQPLPWPFDLFVAADAGRLVHLNVAVAATVLIALLQAGSAYLNAYYTVSIGQWIAHDSVTTCMRTCSGCRWPITTAIRSGRSSAQSRTTSTRCRTSRPRRSSTLSSTR